MSCLLFVVPCLLNVLSISADGKIYSFGAGGDGQLGHGDTEVGFFISINDVLAMK